MRRAAFFDIIILMVNSQQKSWIGRKIDIFINFLIREGVCKTEQQGYLLILFLVIICIAISITLIIYRNRDIKVAKDTVIRTVLHTSNTR